ncbi:wax ester/triacylglycerol synthase family O-acyltransferase [Nocardioides sp. R-C-SC26]|uniref:WS/DGAT/MGAT family O-acyltransferase n=1 Tax=Nocardioides sp. R-C-SC26 TaxID=2870414 RepID=UPI001E46AEA3|nr:wax ester/triacylglycerol synthase family O-acyltransferase [Nocardioides sp. R-C-SC26]
MGERLRARDLSFLATETATAPRHNATIEIFEPGASGFDYDRLLELIADRMSFVPRYRQRLVEVPGHLAAPVWVDDKHFDLAYHVRRSALPRPGSDEQLLELVGRIVSRPLDRSRPLWEMYFVEGLSGDRVAVLSKSHQALVDGVHTVDLGQLLLDVTPEPKAFEPDEWYPRGAPSTAGVVVDAIRDTLTDRTTLVDTASMATAAALRSAQQARRRARKVARGLTGRRTRRSAIFGPLSQQRRVLTLETSLADYRTVRAAHGGTINDVILATIAGGMRSYLMTRTESMSGIRQVRTLVPVSVIDEELEATSLGSQIAAHFVDLPIAEPSPIVRLHQVSYSFQAHKETGRSVAANRLAGIAGFAPTTFHAIGSRVASEELNRGYDLCVTNVPGPQTPLYAAGARMVATYPVAPLLERHPLSIAVTSYDGRVFYGITADRDLLPDIDVLGGCLIESLDELLAASTATRAPRGRTTAAKKAAAARASVTKAVKRAAGGAEEPESDR